LAVLLDIIGNTPVVELKRINSKPEVKLFAKLEFYNPGGSVKDRIAKYMIEEAEREGRISPDTKILEATSGNTGIGLAMIARLKGYSVTLLMPESMSIERRKILQALGAEILLTPAEEGMNGAIKRAKELAENPNFYWVDQFENKANVKAHYETTGKEIIEQVGKVDVFVAGIGTGGTISGVGRRLKERFSQVKVVGAEPRSGSKIQGLRCLDDYVPPILDFTVIDEIVRVEDEEAFKCTRELARREGLFVGASSGAALSVALREVKKISRGVVVTVFPDAGFKYLSTDLYNSQNL
jgi:cysteine synthase